MDLKELREILQILHEKDITDFELEEQGVRLRIRRGVVSEVRALPPGSDGVPAPSPVPPRRSGHWNP